MWLERLHSRGRVEASCGWRSVGVAQHGVEGAGEVVGQRAAGPVAGALSAARVVAAAPAAAAAAAAAGAGGSAARRTRWRKEAGGEPRRRAPLGEGREGGGAGGGARVTLYFHTSSSLWFVDILFIYVYVHTVHIQ